MSKQNEVVVSFMDWYDTLDLDDKLDTVIYLEEGKTAPTLRKENPVLERQFTKYLFNLKEVYLEYNADSKVIKEILIENGLTETIIINAILNHLEKSGKLFFDAKSLRSMNDENFASFISTVYTNFYIERNHRSLILLKKELDLKLSLGELGNSCKILYGIINNFYHGDLTYLTLSKFMYIELGFSEEKSKIIIDFIKDNKQELERYFIIKNITYIKKGIDTIIEDYDE